MRVVVALVTLVLVIGLAACSSDKKTAYFVFDTKGPSPTFDIPDFTPGKCHFDYRAQISMLDADTGKQRWVTDVPWSMSSPIVATNGRLLASTSEGWVGLDAASGRPLWQRRFERDEPPVPDAALAGTLTTIDGTGVVGFGADDGARQWSIIGPRDQMLSTDGAFAVAVRQDASAVAFDRRTGKVLWRSPRMARGNGALSAAIFKDVVVVTSQLGPMRGLDRATGRRLWQTVTARGRYRSPLVGTAPGLIVVGDNDNNDPAEQVPGGDRTSYADAFDASTGRRVWRIPGYGGAERVSVQGDLAFEFGGFDLIAYSATDGHERWRTRLEVDKIERSGNLVVIGKERKLVGLDANTGAKQWSLTLPGRINGLLRAGNTLFVGVSSTTEQQGPGRVVAISLLDRSVEWQTPRRDAVGSTPLMTTHGLAVLSNDPTLFCD
jgi:outer membrane protein assembly factor BamB